MSVRTKVLLGQAPLAAVLVLVAILATTTLGSLSQHVNTMAANNYRSVLATERQRPISGPRSDARLACARTQGGHRGWHGFSRPPGRSAVIQVVG